MQHCAGRRRPSQQVALGRKRRHDYEEPEEYAQDQQYEQQYEQQFEQGVDPTPPIAEKGHRGVPLYISVPGALLIVFAAFRIFKKLQSRGYTIIHCAAERHVKVALSGTIGRCIF